MKYHFLLLTSALLFAAFSVHAGETVKVGVVLRFTPELNSNAAEQFQGIELAREAFQSKHPETRIELVKYPHKAGHDSVDHAARQIIDDKVKYVIGGEMSDEAFALAESFHDKKIVFMTTTASNPLLTTGNPLVFRACTSDDQLSKQMAQYVFGLKNIHSIGVLHNTSNAYTDYLTADFLERFHEVSKGKNSPAITEFRFAGEEPDFKSAVTHFKNASVDLVVAFTLQEAIRSFNLLASKAGFNPLYVGGDGWGPNDIFKVDFKGVRNSFWNSESKSVAVKKFKAEFKSKFNVEANASNAVAYDAALILFQAIALAKDPSDAAEVGEKLRTGSFKDTVTANSVKFNSKNTAIKPLYIYEISKAGSKFVKAVE